MVSIGASAILERRARRPQVCAVIARSIPSGWRAVSVGRCVVTRLCGPTRTSGRPPLGAPRYVGEVLRRLPTIEHGVIPDDADVPDAMGIRDERGLGMLEILD